MANTKTVDAELEEIIQAASQIVHESKTSPLSANGTAAPTSEEDNMDYDSDDDDDSKSNHSSSNQTGRKRWQKGDVKRSHHNVLERKRRDLIKDSFTKLKDSIPTLNGRASRAQILKKAADFIQLTCQKNETTRANIDELVKKNLELESKISSMEVKKEPEERGQDAS